MNWLPPVDPAGSPRVTARKSQNPYIPEGQFRRHTAPVSARAAHGMPHPPRDHEDAVQPAEEQEEQEDLPEKVYPTLEEYKRRWDEGLTRHSRANAGEFNRHNLVPDPIPQLWQDVLSLTRRCACLQLRRWSGRFVVSFYVFDRFPMSPSTN